jgi:hypothetical protein
MNVCRERRFMKTIVSQQSEQQIRQPEQKRGGLQLLAFGTTNHTREEPKKDSDIVNEARNESLQKHDFASRRISPPQNMP